MRSIPPGSKLLLGAVLVSLLGVFAITSAAPRPAAAQVTPPADLSRAAVVLQFFAAVTAEDVDGAIALVADNASWIAAPKCPAVSPCQGADAVREQVQANVAGHTSLTVTSIEAVGSVVMGQVQAQTDATRTAGIAGLALTFMVQVPQDKITVWVTLPE